MADFVFPLSDIDRPGRLKSSLGSFWYEIYSDQASVDGIIRGRSMLGRQLFNDLAELEAAMSRFTVPVYHRERWLPLTLRKSEMNANTAVLRYGDAAVFGIQESGRLYQYGEPATRADSSFPLPGTLVTGAIICDQVDHPTVGLSLGVDFLVRPERGEIVFRENPFENPLLVARGVYADGTLADYELDLWLYGALQDESLVHRHFGYILGIGGSGERYRDLVNAFVDSVVEGSTMSAIQNAVAACTGIPFVLEQTETVELVTSDDRGRVIATDRHVYRFPPGAVPLVAAGDETKAGESLVSNVEIVEFQRGTLPDDLRALTLGRGFLAEGYFSELTFENKTVPLVVEEDVDGYTKVSFELGGFPTDVEQFFDDLHAKGVAAEQTLAMLLDRRTNKTGQPRAGALPTTINPLKFLAENVLRHHTFLVRVRGDLGQDAAGLRYLKQIRKYAPPHVAMIVLVELVGEGDVIIMNDGYTEDPQFYLALDAAGDEVDMSSISEDPRLYQVSDRCL